MPFLSYSFRKITLKLGFCARTVALEALQNEVIREVLNVRDISVLKKVKKMLLPEGGADAVAEEVLGEL